MKISKLYADHTNIISKINILRQLCKDAIAANSTEISTHLNQLSTDIGVHLNFEDKYVYPVLRKSSNAAVVALATSYQREMAPLLADYQTFAFKFNTAKAIKMMRKPFTIKLILSSKHCSNALAERTKSFILWRRYWMSSNN